MVLGLRRKWKLVSCKSPSQEEQNGANFSFVAPSSEELRVRKEFDHNTLL